MVAGISCGILNVLMESSVLTIYLKLQECAKREHHANLMGIRKLFGVRYNKKPFIHPTPK